MSNIITKEMFDKYKKEQQIKQDELKKEIKTIKKDQQQKFRRFVVFAVVLCLILSGITGVASYTLAANQVGYTAKDTSWTVDNTQDAIDELRDTVGYALVGSIFSYMGNNAPFGYLACDGTEYNIADYPRLAEHFTSEFGSANYFGGDGETTFAVPNLTGKFLKGSNTAGVNEEAGLPNITGTFGVTANGARTSNMSVSSSSGAFYSGVRSGWRDGYTDGYNSNPTYYGGFDASRSSSIYGKSTTVTPENTSVLYIIKY